MAEQTPVALVLVGGANHRFAPLEHKSFVRFQGMTLLERQLRALQAAGVREAVIIGNPANRDLAAQVAAQVPELRTALVEQTVPRGMGDALLCAGPALIALDGRSLYIVQPTDIVAPDLHRRVLSAWAEGEQAGLLVGYRTERYFPGGYLRVRDSMVQGIVEKPGPGHEPSNLVTIVAHLHRDGARLLRLIAEEYGRDVARDDHYERAVDRLLQEGGYRAFEYDGPWVPIKYPWHVLDAMEYFLGQVTEQRIAPDAQISPRAEVTGNVVIEEGVRIFSGAHVVGPAYLGRGAVVGDGALVRGAMIGAGTVVGFRTEVARSYVGDRVNFHINYVGDSVIADAVNLGAGTITANWRFDERPVRSLVAGELLDTGRGKFGTIIGREARTGINVSLLPGVKIGARSWIGPGAIVERDVEPDRLVRPRQPLETLPHPLWSRQPAADAPRSGRDGDQ
ncbi:MAG: NTP transferase domain-containing protein [Chloroflexi bacterium]|nr:NTP transferase domain-containing protein [Chloroflexota bacterium]